MNGNVVIAAGTLNFAGATPVGVVSVGSEGQERRIQNVAAGKISEDSTDAINGSQLYSVSQQIGTVSNNVNQLNQVVGNLHNRIGDVSKHSDASAASAIAVASMPQAFLPGKNLVAVGGGTYHGQTGYAIGFSTISDNGHWIVKGTATGNSKNRYGAGIGAGYQW